MKDQSLQWLKIQHAHTVAMGLGFQAIEVPWIVSPKSSKITFPTGVQSIGDYARPNNTKHDGYLIGSGEQGFMEIWDTLSPDTKYVTTTPCFRAEEQYNPGITEPWFIKTELIWTTPKNEEQALNVLIMTAKRIMGAWARKLDTVLLPDKGIDLFLNGLEVGSYGIRTHENRTWVYGTGLAEPRFTTALKSGNNRVTVGKTK